MLCRFMKFITDCYMEPAKPSFQAKAYSQILENIVM